MSLVLLHHCLYVIHDMCPQQCPHLGSGLTCDFANCTCHQQLWINDGTKQTERCATWVSVVDHNEFFFGCIKSNPVCQSPFMNRNVRLVKIDQNIIVGLVLVVRLENGLIVRKALLLEIDAGNEIVDVGKKGVSKHCSNDGALEKHIFDDERAHRFLS